VQAVLSVFHSSDGSLSFPLRLAKASMMVSDLSMDKIQ
jgi:hypothetical protein